MISSLKNHPFAVEAFFERSIVLTYAVSKDQLQDKIPECLQLDTFKDQWAFIAIAMVQTKHLRPKGFPEFLGQDFFLIGYRIFVRYVDNRGKRLRGLYILKSETDKIKMEYLGNLFTKYKYATTDINLINSDHSLEINSQLSEFKCKILKTNESVALPSKSPFKDWAEARKFAGPLPFTFSFDVNTRKVLIVEGVRESWIPKPIEVIDYNFQFLESMNFSNAFLANAFMIENIPYYWKKGKLEQWNP